MKRIIDVTRNGTRATYSQGNTFMTFKDSGQDSVREPVSTEEVADDVRAGYFRLTRDLVFDTEKNRFEFSRGDRTLTRTNKTLGTTHALSPRTAFGKTIMRLLVEKG